MALSMSPTSSTYKSATFRARVQPFRSLKTLCAVTSAPSARILIICRPNDTRLMLIRHCILILIEVLRSPILVVQRQRFISRRWVRTTLRWAGHRGEDEVSVRVTRQDAFQESINDGQCKPSDVRINMERVGRIPVSESARPVPRIDHAIVELMLQIQGHQRMHGR